ncbi:MAG: hypothetical protein U1D06_06500, partial [Paracoccaceae bacterium]|nr:hypothetical protein [Paracoccaceae bacterium]
ETGQQTATHDAPDHGAFLYAQLRGRALERLMPKDWPAAIAAAAMQANAADLGCLMLAAMQTPAASPPLADIPKAGIPKAGVPKAGMPDFPPHPADAELLTELHRRAARHAIAPDALQGCTLPDLIADWYCLRQGGAMAAPFIPAASIRIYRFLSDEFATPSPAFAAQLPRFFGVFLAVLGRSLDRMQAPTPAELTPQI